MSVVVPIGVTQEATVTLTAAQTLAIFTTPVQILPAPGAGLAYFPMAAYFNYRKVTTAYTDHGGVLNVIVGTTGLIGLTTLGFWNAASSQGQIVVPSSFPAAISAMANGAMTVQQNTANPTGGDGLIAVTVIYVIVPAS